MTEALFFLKLLGIAIVPACILGAAVTLVIRFVYLHYAKFEWIIVNLLRGVLRAICWLLTCITDGVKKADERR